MVTKRIQEHQITGGATITLKYSDNVEAYYIFGTATLSSGLDITVDTPFNDMHCRIIYDANITLGGNTITLFGKVLPAHLVAKEVIIDVYYYQGKYFVVLLPSLFESQVIATDAIVDDAVTTAKINAKAVTFAEMANLAQGYIIVGNGSDRPSELDVRGVDKILVGDGTDLISATVAGSVGIVVSGSTATITVANEAIDENMIAASALGDGMTGGTGSKIAINPDTTNGTSLVVTGDGIRLTGDQNSPGVSKKYSTDAGGTKLWA